jgi:hypothetical protein
MVSKAKAKATAMARKDAAAAAAGGRSKWRRHFDMDMPPYQPAPARNRNGPPPEDYFDDVDEDEEDNYWETARFALEDDDLALEKEKKKENARRALESAVETQKGCKSLQEISATAVWNGCLLDAGAIPAEIVMRVLGLRPKCAGARA